MMLQLETRKLQIGKLTGMVSKEATMRSGVQMKEREIASEIK